MYSGLLPRDYDEVKILSFHRRVLIRRGLKDAYLGLRDVRGAKEKMLR